MLDANDARYYRQRERTARQRAAEAISPDIAAIHGEMADRYAALATTQTALRARPRLKLKA